jgi:hypothetical protein
MEFEKMQDFTDGTARDSKMTYKELVADLNNDIKAIEEI